MSLLKKTVVWLLILALCAGFAACGSSESTDETTEPAGLQAPADPDVIATVVTGEQTKQVKTLAQLTAAIDATGNSQITLWQDISSNVAIRLPYTCTIDCNGFAIRASLNAGNGLQVEASGSENAVFTLKNGLLQQYGVGIQVSKGGLVVENMTVFSTGGTPIAIVDPNKEYRHINSVKNSTLISGNSACVSFYSPGLDYTDTGITLDNCTIISGNPDGTHPFSRIGSDTNPGTIYLGEHVSIYSRAQVLGAEGMYYAGNLAPRTKDTQSVTFGDSTWDNMYCWSTDHQDDAMNLLMIGNSFCYYYVQELYGVASAAGVEINVVNLYEAGCYVQEHWDWLTNEGLGKDKYALWITNSMGRWKHGDYRESYTALPYLDWDVISLQQHFGSGVKDVEASLAKCTPYTKNLFDYLKTNYPQAQLYWHETWAYQVGHESMPSVEDQRLRQDNIIRVSQILAEESGVPIIPAGHAWKTARADSRIGDGMCRSDKYHDGDTGGGQYLNACLWFEILTGKSCIGNTWRPDTYMLSEEMITALQEVAHQTVAEMYGADYAK